MPDSGPVTDDTPAKRSIMPLILGLGLAIVGGGGGFYATWSGMLLATESGPHESHDAIHDFSAEVAFVAVDPLVISLGNSSSASHLQFRADLEVPLIHKDEVTNLMPRIVDVFNSYLRALDPGDLEDRAALTKLRAQLMRRVQVVLGRDRVNDLLVMEFVLN
ncbi:MAG: flagellar basal body-associated FliL family protein [Sulfitobacter sp.]